MSTNIKKLIKDQSAHFVRYQNQELWYVTDNGFEFPIAIADVGGARINSEEKAIFLMTYIRKHLKMIDAARAAAT